MDILKSLRDAINKLFNVSYLLAPHHLIFGYHLIVDGDDNNRFGSDRLSNKSKLYKDKINSRKVGRNGRSIPHQNFWCGRIYRIGASGIPICRERTAPHIGAARSLSLLKRGPYGIAKALGSLPSGVLSSLTRSSFVLLTLSLCVPRFLGRSLSTGSYKSLF